MEGLKVLGDLWQTKDNSLYTWQGAKTKFNMAYGKECIWEKIVENNLVI